MNLEEDGLAVAAGSAADVLGAGKGGVGSHVLQDLRALPGLVVHDVAVDAVVAGNLLNQAKQARIGETFFLASRIGETFFFYLPSFHRLVKQSW